MSYYTAKGRDIEEDPDAPVSARALNAGQLAFQQDLGNSSALEAGQLALAAALAAGAYRPSDGQVNAALGDCIVVDGLTEAVEKLVTTDQAASGGVDSAEYEDGFYDAAGNRVGTVTGTAVVLSYTPHMWQYHSSTTEFHDGTFETSGVIDCTAILNGMTQILQVVGRSGRYAGKRGFMTLTLHDHRQQPPLYRTQFVMR
ncbi:allene oxide cyclase barrel-like domain-containing protein [Micromonospora eburnea]|uniref:Allene oxide cyclase barrel-like domain-containing protein n=1 Tax=Micromonospora eburnea TaxID=227316 RepID=A0A1C6V0W8_9ACTN|nr:hypothetical protein [Micromonospora eburnea]SCL59847.1 hypothetical protein GA0070604_4156 [Micromonospora eburnea]